MQSNLEEVDEHLPLTGSPSGYGSTVSNSLSGSDDDDDTTTTSSFHLGRGLINSKNIWTSMRFTTSFSEFGNKYNLVPSHLADNLKLMVDPNLDPGDKGTLYYAQEAFYDNSKQPEYALTVPPDIYQRVFTEVHDAQNVPCGLYFCCHGGDGAHTGVSHEDYVDIRVAWTLVFIVFAVLIYLSVALPWPDDAFR